MFKYLLFISFLVTCSFPASAEKTNPFFNSLGIDFEGDVYYGGENFIHKFDPTPPASQVDAERRKKRSKNAPKYESIFNSGWFPSQALDKLNEMAEGCRSAYYQESTRATEGCINRLMQHVVTNEKVYQKYSDKILEWYWALSDRHFTNEKIQEHLLRQIDIPEVTALLEARRDRRSNYAYVKLKAFLHPEMDFSSQLMNSCKELYALEAPIAAFFNVSIQGSLPCPYPSYSHDNIFFRSLPPTTISESHKLFLGALVSMDWKDKDSIYTALKVIEEKTRPYKAWLHLRPQLKKDLSNLSNEIVLVEYVQYYHAIDMYGNGYWRNIAFIIKKENNKLVVRFKPLGSDFKIRENADKLLRSVRNRQTNIAINNNLFDQLIAPFWEIIKDKEQIYFSGLTYFPLEGLQEKNSGKFLAELKEVAYFDIWHGVAERFITAVGKKQKEPGYVEGLIIANPDYGLVSKEILNTPDVLAGGERGELSIPFDSLPYAKDEGEKIHVISEEKLHMTKPEDASKYLINNSLSSNVLHFATHGFFSPVMGLALKGANQLFEKNSDTLKSDSDGILTASEISVMNLSAAKLVVLSACETGVSLNRRSNTAMFTHSVDSLASSFRHAGVKSVVMTRWNINDRASSILMEAFYSEYYRGTVPIKALSWARKYLKKNNFYNDLYYWGGFTLYQYPLKEFNIDKDTENLVLAAKNGDIPMYYIHNKAEQDFVRSTRSALRQGYTGGSEPPPPVDIYEMEASMPIRVEKLKIEQRKAIEMLNNLH